jgi:hypothetical protein
MESAMNTLKLKDDFIMRIVPYNNKVKLIIIRNNEEYVCRMEMLHKLKEFTELKEARIFRGRLQLFKEEGLINVIAKGEVAGIIDEDSFTRCLDALTW